MTLAIRGDSWQVDLGMLVDDALSQPRTPAELVEACVEQAQRCDVGDADDVIFAFSQMFRLAGHLFEADDPELAEQPLAVTVGIALDSYVELKIPELVADLARHLVAWDRSDLGLGLLDEAVGLDVATPNEDRPAPLVLLQNLRGDLLRRLGELDAAEVALRAAQDALDGDSPQHDRARSAVLNNLGLVRSQKGDLAQAKELLVRSLEIADRLGMGSLEIAIRLDNLGVVEADLAREAGPLWLADDYVNVVVDEHLRQAEEYFDRARERFVAELPGSADDYVTSLVNSSDVAQQRGDADALETLSRLAFELAAGQETATVTMWSAVALRGRVLQDRGESQAAAELLAAWFAELWPHMELQERLSEDLTTLVRAGTSIGDDALVESVANTIVAVDDELLVRRLTGGSEAEVRHAFVQYWYRAETILGHCLPPGSSGVAPSWLFALVLNRKGILAERQGSAWLQARRTEGARKELLDRVRERRSEMARLDLDGAESEAIRFARRRHDEAERELGWLEAELHRQLGPDTLPVPRVTPAALQASLGPHTLLLDITTAIGPDDTSRYVMFLARADGPVRFKDLGPVDAVDERLSALKALFARPPANDADPRERATEIREHAPVLLDPDEPPGDHIVVASSGAWGEVPFCLLPDAHGRPLIDNHLVTLVPSSRWLVNRASGTGRTARGPASAPPVVLGDPDFDLQFAEQVPFFLSMRYPRLPHAGVEVDDVARLLGVTPVVQQDATRQRLLDVQHPKALHIATHGVFLDAIGSQAEMAEPRESVLRNVAGAVVIEESDVLGFPQSTGVTDDATAVHRRRVEWLREIGPRDQLSRSALLLTGFNAWLAGVATAPDVGTGMLSAGEFALLDLTSTELVVLSACETGVGAVDYADGSLLGLRTAALAAGAACCVSTLWKVGDATTAALMSTFYRGLAAGQGKGPALRAAQLAVRQQHPDPYYWAGWVVEGALER